MTTDATYIPLDAAESAVLKDTNTLLPKDVYRQLTVFINQALTNVPTRQTDLNDTRTHNAISIDGARGTGKTSVLVNLKRYLQLKANERNTDPNAPVDCKALLGDIHVLEPIDPTLLEDGESLFLHVIVAAVLHDKDVKEAQRHRPEQARVLNQCLEKLAHGLESVERQKDLHGMDKVRALYGNKHLADCVQDFFRAALDLLDKNLLVLPIDDVDTSLNRAFENLEVIRRYLTTPYVLPIVSGDRSLYGEVTWRDFYGRLTMDSSYQPAQAYGIAEELANEYQRKILPLPRRLSMPAVSEYWQNRDIKLGKDGMPLAGFIAWLEIFVAGPVNGLEGSRLAVPIPSIRALTQLINHCGNLIPSLPGGVLKAEDTLQVRRSWQMPTVPQAVIKNFHLKHQELGKEKKREYGAAYSLFAEELAKHTPVEDSLASDKVKDWAQRLGEYFRFEPQAGAVYLALLASQHWQQWAANKPEVRQHGVFDTPLYQPLQHVETNFDLFDKQYDLSDWAGQLQKRLPEGWLAEVKEQQTILPYPVAEVGINSATNWGYWKDIKNLELNNQVEGKAIFLLSLLTQHNFYTKSKQTMMLNIGRMFELIVASLVGPVGLPDLQRIQQQAPFFSTSALAPTKVIDVNKDEEDGKGKNNQKKKQSQEFVEDRPAYVLDLLDDHLMQLQQEIAEWRKKHDLDKVSFAPWLVYKVFNKVYSQVASAEYDSNGMTWVGNALEIAGKVFFATWSAFGSFEKGNLFGLPDVIATVNLNSPYNFENNDHYRVNVAPFGPNRAQMNSPDSQAYKDRSEYGKKTRSASYFLADHPLRSWIEEILSIEWPKEEMKAESESIGKKAKLTAKEWLCQKLDLDPSQVLNVNRIYERIKNKKSIEIRSIVSELHGLFPDAAELKRLGAAIDKLNPGGPH